MGRPVTGFIRRSAALTLLPVLILSGLAQAAAQKAAPKAAAQNNARNDRANSIAKPSTEPIIRVALVTDVSSATLACASGLVVRKASANEGDGPAPLVRQIRVEVSQLESKPEAKRRKSTYQIYVSSFEDASRARRLASELQRKYQQPAATALDRDSGKFEVSIGAFDSPGAADSLLAQLRETDYRSARIEKVGVEPPATEGAKHAAQSEIQSGERRPRLLAKDGDRVVASDDERLLFSAANQEGDEAALRDAGPRAQQTQTAAPQATKATRRTGDSYDFSRNGKGAEDNNDESTPQPIGSEHPSPASSASPTFIRVGGKQYRGDIKLTLNSRGRINVINLVSIEDYLRGVVPMELSPLGYPEIEALKAQAVAARSYALFHRGEHEDEGYDLHDDARSQVYGGVAAEHELSDRAIEETRGMVASAPGEDGRFAPIDALYTANCGGHTENNEDVFGGKPRSYLRAVACEVDPLQFVGREIVTARPAVTVISADGRSLTREAALLEVLGFQLPRQLSSRYLAGPADSTELQSWADSAARLAGQHPATGIAATSVLGFAELVASSVYGEGRAAVLVTPADASYILSGLESGNDSSKASRSRVAARARSSLALLIKTGALRLPADGVLDVNSTVSRAMAVETLARALSISPQASSGLLKLRESGSPNGGSIIPASNTPGLGASSSGSEVSNQKSASASPRSEISNPKSQISNLKSQISNTRSEIAQLKFETAAGVENGRLLLAYPVSRSEAEFGAATQPRTYTTVETSNSRITRGNSSSPGETTSKTTPSLQPDAKSAANSRSQSSEKSAATATTGSAPPALAMTVAKNARLFRDLGGASYPVTRLRLIGGEQIIYHVDSNGEVDFLEAAPSERSAATDRFSRVASWQQRVAVEDLAARLARGGVKVGKPQSITPLTLSTSGRVTEIEIDGSGGHSRLRGARIKNVLGLRENLFVVDSETDANGRVVAFVFTGRGWGHGVGMCQTGAYGLAREGYSFKSILQKYYTGVRVQKIY